jgi:hypothetical protein
MLKVDVNSVADVLRELACGHIAAETRHDGFTTCLYGRPLFDRDIR